MNYKKLYLIVEGDNDQLFFESIIEPLFYPYYDQVITRQWAQEAREVKKSLIKSFIQDQNDFIIFADKDVGCIFQRRENISKKYHIDTNKIIIVVKMIESWYYSGIDEEFKSKYRIKSLSDNNSIDKNQFESIIPTKKIKREFLNEIIDKYSFNNARQNSSFNYFYKKYLERN